MSASIVPFSFESNEIRSVQDDNGEPLFVAKDIAAALGFKDPVNAIKLHCNGVAIHHPILDSMGRPQQVRVIQEPDLYRLIIRSTLPAACGQDAQGLCFVGRCDADSVDARLPWKKPFGVESRVPYPCGHQA